MKFIEMRSACATLIGWVIAGCATLGREPMPPDAIVIDVPLVTQEEAHECGLASLAALASHYGVSIPSEVSERLRASAERNEGLSGGEIRDALRSSGLRASIIEGSVDRSDGGVYRQLDLGRPLLVMVATKKHELHASLLVGYDPKSGRLLHLDPLRGTFWEAPTDFAIGWQRAGHFALIAVPPESLDAAESRALEDLAFVAGADLEEQLAGHISDDETKTALIVAGAIILLLILI